MLRSKKQKLIIIKKIQKLEDPSYIKFTRLKPLWIY